MQRAALIAAAACAFLAIPVSIATGVPASSQPPSISGYPGYNSKLTCKPGTWSADAKTFGYEWLFSGSDTVFATTQTYRVDASNVGHDVICRVTATDADGAAATADSASVRIAQGRTTIDLKAKKVQHKKVTLTGKVGPRAAVKGAGVVAYRVERGAAFQLFGKTTLKPDGKFSIVAPDKPGKHKYKVNFNPKDPSIWLFASDTVKVNLKRR